MKKSSQLFLCLIIAAFILSCGGGSNERQESPGTSITQKPSAAQPGTIRTGAEEYTKFCLTCHQADGNGVRGQFPPLAGNDAVTGAADSLIRIVLFGLEGPIVVNGQTQNYSQVMPAQDYLTDQQIADVLSYIRDSWGNKASPVKPGEVAGIRKSGK